MWPDILYVVLGQYELSARLNADTWWRVEFWILTISNLSCWRNSSEAKHFDVGLGNGGYPWSRKSLRPDDHHWGRGAARPEHPRLGWIWVAWSGVHSMGGRENGQPRGWQHQQTMGSNSRVDRASRRDGAAPVLIYRGKKIYQLALILFNIEDEDSEKKADRFLVQWRRWREEKMDQLPKTWRVRGAQQRDLQNN